MSIITLVACSQKEESNQSILRVAQDNDIITMDQHLATDGTSFEIIKATVAGLFKSDEDGNVVPELVSEYEVTDDGLTYTFKLRNDAKWDNGTSITANDFVFSWRRLVDPTTASEYSYIADVAGVENVAKVTAGEFPKESLGVEAVDEYTLKVTLERPVAFFLRLMVFPAFYPLNEEFVTEQGSSYAAGPDYLLSSGPFKLSEWNSGHSYTIEKNDSYFGKDSVSLDGVEFLVISDHQTAVLEYESGNLDVINLSGELVGLYENNEELMLRGQSSVWYIAPNHSAEELQNYNLLCALAYAVNKEQLTDVVLNDGSIAANFLIPMNFATGPDGKSFRETSPTYLNFDLQKAQSYWEVAKSELGVDNLTLELLFDNTGTGKKYAEFIQAQLQANLPGLTITLKPQPKKNRIQLMFAGDYDIALTAWGADYTDPTSYLDMYREDSSYNFINYYSKEYNALSDRINKGDLVLDEAGRWEAMKEAEAILLEKDVVFPMYQQGGPI